MHLIVLIVLKLKAQQLTTLRIRSCIEYLIGTDNIPALLLHSDLIQKSSVIDGVSTIVPR